MRTAHAKRLSYAICTTLSRSTVPMIRDAVALERFLSAAVQQTGYGTLPLLGGAYRDPEQWPAHDELAEAFLLNPVSNRASRVQGRTLAATAARVWPSRAMCEIQARVEGGHAHVAPLSGLVFRALGLPCDTAKAVTLFGTARGVLSAAVRLGIVGSYQAQQLQHEVGPWLDTILVRCRELIPTDVCQTAPILDMLQAGHDRLYSRLFQS